MNLRDRAIMMPQVLIVRSHFLIMMRTVVVVLASRALNARELAVLSRRRELTGRSREMTARARKIKCATPRVGTCGPGTLNLEACDLNLRPRKLMRMWFLILREVRSSSSRGIALSCRATTRSSRGPHELIGRAPSPKAWAGDSTARSRRGRVHGRSSWPHGPTRQVPDARFPKLTARSRQFAVTSSNLMRTSLMLKRTSFIMGAPSRQLTGDVGLSSFLTRNRPPDYTPPRFSGA